MYASPMSILAPNKVGEVNCYDVLNEVGAALDGSLCIDEDAYVLGGIVSSALKHEATIVDKLSTTIFPLEEAAESVVRPNGTTRDIDVLVRGVLTKDRATEIKSNLEDAVDGKLVVSVFGMDKYEPEVNPVVHSVADWISHRTIDEDGVIRHELFPLERPADPESYVPWEMQLPSGARIPTLHPAGHVLAYAMRSISGVRTKDGAKFEAMAKQVIPQFKEEVHDGPFRSWLEFAIDIYIMREFGYLSADLDEGVRKGATAAEVALFGLKSRALRWVERQERIVDFAQGDRMQKLLNIFVHAK